jgi:Dolichyl-phosphate-mannose-protein mannosyltransferase
VHLWPGGAGYGLAVELANTARWQRAPKVTPNTAFRFLLVLFVLLTLSLSVLIPAWEANDEPDHFRNVQTLVSGRWYRMEPGAGYSAHQAPLYYLGLAAIQKAVGLSAFTPTLEANPKAPERGLFTHNDGDAQRRVVLLRMPSILLGALTVWLTRKVARRSGVSEWGALLAAAIVATLPRFVFLSAVINNDTLVITLGAWATLLAVGLVADDHVSAKRLCGFGAVLGLMLETKLSSVPIVIALALGVVVARFVQSRGDWVKSDQLVSAHTEGFVQNIGKRSVTKVATGKVATAEVTSTQQSQAPDRFRLSARLAATIAVAALVVAAPVLVSNQLRYGDPLASKASVDYFRELLPPLVAVPQTWEWFGLAVGSGFATSFWYVSGWNQFRWKAETYVPLWMLVSMGLLGCLMPRRKVTAVKAATDPNGALGESQKVSGFVPLLTAVCVASVSVVWILATQTTQWQARTSYPGLAAFATLISTGYRKLRIPMALQFLLPALTLAGTLYAIHADVINRYFV